MVKIDLKKDLKQLYNPSHKEVALVDIPSAGFLMIDGMGDPNTSKDFQDAIEALFGVSYTLKFALKKKPKYADSDYVVMPLEGLWWTETGNGFNVERRDLWQWTAMILQPPLATAELIKMAMDEVSKKKGLPALSKMRFETFHEGKAAQIMHIGPFSAEGPTIARVHDFVSKNGYKLRGKHHEIYLSDIRRTAPEKLKTVIRQPLG